MSQVTAFCVQGWAIQRCTVEARESVSKMSVVDLKNRGQPSTVGVSPDFHQLYYWLLSVAAQLHETDCIEQVLSLVDKWLTLGQVW